MNGAYKRRQPPLDRSRRVRRQHDRLIPTAPHRYNLCLLNNHLNGTKDGNHASPTAESLDESACISPAATRRCSTTSAVHVSLRSKPSTSSTTPAVCWDGCSIQTLLSRRLRGTTCRWVDAVQRTARRIYLHQPLARTTTAAQALDDALSSPDEIRKTIDNTRQILANAKARRAHDHARLRAESEARHYRSA